MNYLMKEHPEFRLAFSVSATSRPPRGEERNGVEYYFLTEEEFLYEMDWSGSAVNDGTRAENNPTQIPQRKDRPYI